MSISTVLPVCSLRCHRFAGRRRRSCWIWKWPTCPTESSADRCGRDVLLKSPRSSCSLLVKLAAANPIGPLECDGQLQMLSLGSLPDGYGRCHVVARAVVSLSLFDQPSSFSFFFLVTAERRTSSGCSSLLTLECQQPSSASGRRLR